MPFSIRTFHGVPLLLRPFLQGFGPDPTIEASRIRIIPALGMGVCGLPGV